MNTIDPAAYEGDLVSRLRHWRGLHLAHSGELFEEAAEAIERCRKNMTLTDDEREAVWLAANTAEDRGLKSNAAVLRSLLARLA